VNRWLLSLTWLCLIGAFTAAQPPTSEKEDLKRMQGKWYLVGGHLEGKKVGENEAAALDWAFAIQANRVTKFIKGQIQESYSLSLDPTKSPKEVDMVQLDGLAKGAKIRGIFAVEDDTLKFCLRERFNGRPGKFGAREGSEDVYWILWKFDPKAIVYRRSLVIRMVGFAMSPVVQAALVEGQKKSKTPP
jgi:uncharacterized protein (TIGR03067 family)